MLGTAVCIRQNHVSPALIYSSSNLPDPLAEYDLCIIGSGPAGMTLALELKYTGIKICILESGDRTLRERDDIGPVQSEGIEIRRDSRVRSIGGSSQTWSGFIAPLDDIDLTPREGLHDGWPLTADELYQASDDRGFRYKIPPRQMFTRRDDVPADRRLPDIPGIEPKVFKTQAPVVRYGDQYAYAFLAPGFDLITDATVVSLQLAGAEIASKKVVAAEYATSTGERFVLKAARFVLAASAVETIRILKNSAVPDQSGRLGYGFMNHPKGNVGWIRFNRPVPREHELFQVREDGYEGYLGLRLVETIQREEGLLNSYLRLEPRTSGEFPKARKLSRSVKAFGRAIGAKDVALTARSSMDVLRNLSGLPQTFHRLASRLRDKRQTAVQAATLRCFMEMQPMRASNVTIAAEKDRFGVPLARVVHDITEQDLRSAERLVEVVSKGLQEEGLGAVSVSPKLRDLLRNDASHHLGGAAMGNDPARSVVDRDLKLHGTDNLFVAGGAVFPTGGSANPTMTIVALSMRLADHLASFGTAKARPSESVNHKALVIGAGRRVKEDVVPAFETASNVSVAKIFATGKRAVFGPGRYYETTALRELSAEDVSTARIIYIAVPPRQVEGVLSRLSGFDCGHITLMIDTPAFPGKDLGTFFGKFRNVVIAEDSVLLPWLNVLPPGHVQSIALKHSGYRYHAVALARAVAGPGKELAEIGSVSGKKNRITVKFGNGGEASIFGPRDYANGVLEIRMADGRELTSVPGMAGSIEPILADGYCTGFRCGDAQIAISEEESILLGSFARTDTVVTKMLDLKRVGLKRMIEATLGGNVPYAYEMALEDAELKW